jgi:hypothetical protein
MKNHALHVYITNIVRYVKKKIEAKKTTEVQTQLAA